MIGKIKTSDIMEMMLNLPPEMAYKVRIEEVADAIKHMINLTGFDLLDGLRESDVDKFIGMHSKNYGLKIYHDKMNGTITFVRL